MKVINMNCSGISVKRSKLPHPKELSRLEEKCRQLEYENRKFS
jgi:hypothetical protein